MLPPATVTGPQERKAASVPAPALHQSTRSFAHGLRWAALIAFCIAAAASWLWLQTPDPIMSTDVSLAPSAPPEPLQVAPPPEAEPRSDGMQEPEPLPAQSPDAASAASAADSAEYLVIKSRFDRAYSAYTTLITEGGSGNAIEARDEYAAAYEELKRFEAAHPEYAQ